MDKKVLKASEICKIIKACKAAGVQKLTYMGLEISLEPRQGPGDVTEQASSVNHEIPVMSEQTQTIEMLDESSLLDAEDAQLLIDDPFAFEKAQMRKDVERARRLDEQTHDRRAQ